MCLWLEHHGLSGLHDRLERLALAYQAERSGLEADDLTTLVVRAISGLCHQAASRAIGPTPPETFHIRMAELVPVVQALANHLSLSGGNITAHRLGFVLAKLRVSHGPRLNGNQGRQWLVTRADLQRWSVSYGIRPPAPEGRNESNSDREQ